MEEDNEEEVEKFGIYRERRVAFWRCGGFVDPADSRRDGRDAQQMTRQSPWRQAALLDWVKLISITKAIKNMKAKLYNQIKTKK